MDLRWKILIFSAALVRKSTDGSEGSIKKVPKEAKTWNPSLYHHRRHFNKMCSCGISNVTSCCLLSDAFPAELIRCLDPLQPQLSGSVVKEVRGGLWRILSLVITDEPALSSAGSLPLKMTTGCTQPPCNPTHLINWETVRISAHQYPVNILETQVVAVAACVHNILFTIRLIISPGDAKKSRKRQYFPQTSDALSYL